MKNYINLISYTKFYTKNKIIIINKSKKINYN